MNANGRLLIQNCRTVPSIRAMRDQGFRQLPILAIYTLEVELLITPLNHRPVVHYQQLPATIEILPRISAQL